MQQKCKLIDVIELSLVISLVNIKDVPVISFVYLISSKTNNKFYIMQKNWETGISIYEDFSKDTLDLRETLWEKVLQYHRQNKFACLNYWSIIVRDFDNVRWTVSFFVCLVISEYCTLIKTIIWFLFLF